MQKKVIQNLVWVDYVYDKDDRTFPKKKNKKKKKKKKKKQQKTTHKWYGDGFVAFLPNMNCAR